MVRASSESKSSNDSRPLMKLVIANDFLAFTPGVTSTNTGVGSEHPNGGHRRPPSSIGIKTGTTKEPPGSGSRRAMTRMPTAT